MENDLISRQKLIDDLEAWRKRLDRRVSRFDDMVIHALPAVFDLVNEQETVEAEPVRHGQWVPVSLIDHKGRVIMEQYKCSECGRLEDNKQPYCHCCAKMDAKEDA